MAGERRDGACPWRRVWRVEARGGAVTLPADLPVPALQAGRAGPLLVRMRVEAVAGVPEPVIVLRVWRLRRRGGRGACAHLTGVGRGGPGALTGLEGVDILPAG